VPASLVGAKEGLAFGNQLGDRAVVDQAAPPVHGDADDAIGFLRPPSTLIWASSIGPARLGRRDFASRLCGGKAMSERGLVGVEAKAFGP